MEEDIKKTLYVWLKTTQVGVPLTTIQAHLRTLAKTPEKAAWGACIVNHNKGRNGRKWDWKDSWLYDHMHAWGFSFRVGTTAARKLPANAAELHELFLLRFALEMRRELPEGVTMLGPDGERVPATIIPPSLIVNADQGGIPLLGLRNTTWALKGSKGIPLQGGKADKRMVTIVLASDARGDMVPLQCVVEGKTEMCVRCCMCSICMCVCMYLFMYVCAPARSTNDHHTHHPD